MAEEEWSIDRHDLQLFNVILRGDWDGVHSLTEEATKHDKDIARRTYAIWNKHRHLA